MILYLAFGVALTAGLYSELAAPVSPGPAGPELGIVTDLVVAPLPDADRPVSTGLELVPAVQDAEPKPGGGGVWSPLAWQTG